MSVLDLDERPAPAGEVVADVWRYRHVLTMLARADFQVRYKRASFGVAWALAVPLLQATVMAVVFSRFVKVPTGLNYPVFVLSGVLAWSYFANAVGTGGTAIVEGSTLTDKVWFPRALLPAVAPLANLVALSVSMVVLVIAIPVFGVQMTWRVVLLVPACALLLAFSVALNLVLAALHVYFRDVRFLVQAALLVWFYATPIVYPAKLVGSLQPFLDANPLTGVVSLFHLATVGPDPHWVRALLVSVGVTIALAAAAVEIYRRHDRLFADLL